MSSKIGYELFVDIGEPPLLDRYNGVRRTKIQRVFSKPGDKMIFLFDYGESWRFIVELKETRGRIQGEYLPAVLESKGEAPKQYSICER